LRYLAIIQSLLQQLGKTPFINKEKPTPVDEAASLAWFLENVFYKVASEIQSKIDSEMEVPVEEMRQLIELGFWPGGDRGTSPNFRTVTSPPPLCEMGDFKPEKIPPFETCAPPGKDRGLNDRAERRKGT